MYESEIGSWTPRHLSEYGPTAQQGAAADANKRWLLGLAIRPRRWAWSLCGKVAYARFGLGDEMQTSAFGPERSVDLKSN
jgi:hypothetical protein